MSTRFRCVPWVHLAMLRAGFISFCGVAIAVFTLGEFKSGFTELRTALAYSAQFATAFGGMGTLLATLGPTLGE